jgi:hypothetical protein
VTRVERLVISMVVTTDCFGVDVTAVSKAEKMAVVKV